LIREKQYRLVPINQAIKLGFNQKGKNEIELFQAERDDL
jgi:hypothetical protein